MKHLILDVDFYANGFRNIKLDAYDCELLNDIERREKVVSAIIMALNEVGIKPSFGEWKMGAYWERNAITIIKARIIGRDNKLKVTCLCNELETSKAK